MIEDAFNAGRESVINVLADLVAALPRCSFRGCASAAVAVYPYGEMPRCLLHIPVALDAPQPLPYAEALCRAQEVLKP